MRVTGSKLGGLGCDPPPFSYGCQLLHASLARAPVVVSEPRPGLTAFPRGWGQQSSLLGRSAADKALSQQLLPLALEPHQRYNCLIPQSSDSTIHILEYVSQLASLLDKIGNCGGNTIGGTHANHRSDGWSVG